ncbi:MAG: hypothetical protein WA393_09770 [Nitrososphaeraceae archaeon]
MQIEEYTLYSNYSANLKLATIVLALLASISSLSLSLNVSPILLTFNKYAFAQQNPVLPNYKGDYRANEPSKVADSRNNSTSNEIQSTSLAHYHPITPTVLYYSSKFDSAGMNSIPSLMQPVSLAHYQPITPAASQDPASSTGQSDSHGSSSGVDNVNNYSGDSSHHSSNDNGNNDNAHYNNDHQKSSSSNHSYNNHNNGDNGRHSIGHHGSTHHGNEGDGSAIIISSSNNYESFGDNNHEHSHYHGSGNDNGDDGGISITSDGGAFASDGGGAFASAGGGGAFASAG